jgi:hypothetical protein
MTAKTQEKFGNYMIHSKATCTPPCPFHAPSDHPLKEAPKHIRADKAYIVERICEHGVGHDDPDSVAYMIARGHMWAGTHGCDGCCTVQHSEVPELLCESCAGQVHTYGKDCGMSRLYVDSSSSAYQHADCDQAIIASRFDDVCSGCYEVLFGGHRKPTVYVCHACGKTANETIDFSDVSCAVNAVLCYKESLVYENGRVVQARAVEQLDDKEKKA